MSSSCVISGREYIIEKDCLQRAELSPFAMAEQMIAKSFKRVERGRVVVIQQPLMFERERERERERLYNIYAFRKTL